eukprot:CAMPEP_0174962344 /NCGR_PEP_ID=MMETSP0004_2-20121128/4733_1 /TAXON_ID=420556 /ORGANISM="Ochromonas sp., Strain CCMP1393" /LENGTH=126 /DNA_ID=CAMNT_0016210869 /DNA_START=159 /DNA_END=539 /DNA_ORIENTATION=-
MAQHVMLMKEISQAADEEALAKLSNSALPSIDVENPPKELEEWSTYFSLGAVGTSEKFTPDPTAWQNMGFGDYAATEAQRSETWPFLVGFITVNILLGFGLGAALPKEARDHSKYVAMLEGRQTAH